VSEWFKDLVPLGPDAQVIPGSVAFNIMDAQGVPLDVLMLLLKERGIVLDVVGFIEAGLKSKNFTKDTLRRRMETQAELPVNVFDACIEYLELKENGENQTSKNQ
jgi:alanyl-tRNA synthetase